MALEKWLAIASTGLFAMFAGEMISIYYFMTDVPENLEFTIVFSGDPKILQFISIGAAPAGVMAGVAFIMSRRYGSRNVGLLIAAGGAIMLAGMATCHLMIDGIDEKYLTDAVTVVPAVFMALSAPVIGVGMYLTRQRKRRPRKEYF